MILLLALDNIHLKTFRILFTNWPHFEQKFFRLGQLDNFCFRDQLKIGILIPNRGILTTYICTNI